MSDHAVTAHPAVRVLAAHEVTRWTRWGTLAHCTCGTTIDCSGDAWDGYAAHLTDMLQQAGLLRPAAAGDVMAVVVEDQPPRPDRARATLGPPLETPTARVLAERADRRTT